MMPGRQFDSLQVGPLNAEIAFGSGGKATEKPDTTQRLFDVNTVPRAEPHQQTQAQFAADPRTWFHARFQHPAQRTMQYDEAQGRPGVGAGLHVGSREAALGRVASLGTPREVYHPNTGEDRAPAVSRLFPLRHAGETANPPHRPIGDQFSDWEPSPAGEYYRNEVEHTGSVSLHLPGPHHVLSHRQFVEQAQKSGKSVHPVIAAEAQSAPDYSESRFSPPEQEESERRTAGTKQWANPHLFEPNAVQWPGEGQRRQKNLEYDYRQSLGDRGRNIDLGD